MARASASTRPAAPKCSSSRPSRSASPAPARRACATAYVAVNFIDIYFRTGRYPLPLPNGLGSDAVGVVEAVGPGVTDIKAGDRVGYLLGPQGAYSDVRLMPADVLIPLPARRLRPHRCRR